MDAAQRSAGYRGTGRATTHVSLDAVEVPVDQVQILARERKWVGGAQVNARTPLIGLAGAADRTKMIGYALRGLHAPVGDVIGAVEVGATIAIGEVT